MKHFFRNFSNMFFMIRRVFFLDKKAIFIKIPLCIVSILQTFLPLFFVREILNAIQIKERMNYLLIVVSIFVAVTFFSDILKKLFERLDERQADNTYCLVRKDIAKLITQMPYQEAEQPKTRDFIQLVQNSVNVSSLFDMIFNIITQVITLGGLVAIVSTLQPFFLVLIVAVLILKTGVNGVIRKLWEKWREPINTASRKINYLISVMNNVEYGKEIRVNGLQQWFATKMSGAIDGYIGEMKRYNYDLQKRNVLVEGAVIAQECILYLVLAYQVVRKKMLIGDFSMYLSGITALSNCLSGIIDSISDLLREGQFLGDYRKLAERESIKKEIQKASCRVEIKDGVTICFQKVSFHYPNSEKLILDNISFSLKTNQSLSIVGVNGAGKTTIIKLLCRFYKPTQGKILLNGVDIYEIDMEEYRKLLGVVFQDYRLFAFSVLENVALKLPYDETKTWDALEKSGLKKKVELFKNGLQTSISKEFDEFGVEFSGGESQRVELARVLYKEAEIVALDEPTASLDPITEYQMYKTMHEMTKNKLAIFISHRLSSTRFTDNIMVLQNGHIEEYGSFVELMQNTKGVFYHMYSMQKEQY